MHPHQGDVLKYRERSYEMADQPLEGYFRLINARPEFQRNADGQSGCAATWTIDDGWLFLVDIQGFWADGSPLAIADLFPFAGSRVFAAWWSGLLRGYRSDASLLTRASASRSPDILIQVDCGRIQSSSMVHRPSRREGAMPTMIRSGISVPADRAGRQAGLLQV